MNSPTAHTALLPKLLSGEICVAEAANEVGNVMGEG